MGARQLAVDGYGRAAMTRAGEPEFGDTPAWRRTGITDRQAAGIDPGAPTVHGDSYDADEHNRPRNGLGTYFETDATW